MNGVELIAAEHQRQIDVEGYTEEHDDGHNGGEMAISAAAYALQHTRFKHTGKDIGIDGSCCPLKPKGPIRDLVRAGALIAAEIDRIQRRNGLV